MTDRLILEDGSATRLEDADRLVAESSTPDVPPRPLPPEVILAQYGIDPWLQPVPMTAAAATNAAAEVAAGIGAASDTVVQLSPAAGLAAGSGTAFDATVTKAVSVAAGNAAGVGAAQNATTKESPPASLATGTGTAYQASASVGVNAAAGVAAGTGTAANATVSVAAPAGNASGTGLAQNATTKESVGASLATGTGTASPATAKGTSVAGNASGSAAAYNATATASFPYYISNTGSDAANGLTPATAWLTLAHHNAATIASGAVIHLERGGIWRESLTPKTGVTYTAYGSGAKPSIRGSNVFSGAWTNESGSVWYKGSVSVDPGVFAHNGILGQRKTAKASLLAQWDYWWDDPNDRLYTFSSSDPNGLAVLEYGVRNRILNDYNGVDTTFDNLDVRHNQGDITFGLFSANLCTFTNCDFVQLAGYGMQFHNGSGGTVSFCTFTDWGVVNGQQYAIQSIGYTTTNAQPIDVEDNTFTITHNSNSTEIGAVMNDLRGYLRKFNRNICDGTVGTWPNCPVTWWRPASNMTSFECLDNTVLRPGSTGIALQELDFYGATGTATVARNIIRDSCNLDAADTEALRLRNWASGWTVTAHHNLIERTTNGVNDHHGIRVNAALGVLLYNNTVYGTDDGIRLDNDVAVRTPTATAKNNLSAGNRVTAGHVVAGSFTVEDHNLWFGTVTGFTPAGSDVLTDPLLANPTLNDFRLFGGSPAINAGVAVAGITDGYTGAAPEMGALEAFIVAAAGLAAGTGTAPNPGAKDAPNASRATAVGAAFGATPKGPVVAGLAAGVGSAGGTSPKLSRPAGAAIGTGAAPNAITNIGRTANVATGVGTAYAATVNKLASETSGPITNENTANLFLESGVPLLLEGYAGAVAFAEVASGLGTAYDTTARVAVGAATATGVGTSQTATTTVPVSAGVATGVGIGRDAKTSEAVAPASATGTGTAQNAKATILGSTGVATGVGTAYNATALTPGATFALAGLATATGAAYNATVSITGTSETAPADLAPGTGTAYPATVTLALNPAPALGTGAAHDAAAFVALVLLAALGSGTAYDATASTPGTAGPASGLGTAYDAAVKLLASVAAALGTGTAYDAALPPVYVYSIIARLPRPTWSADQPEPTYTAEPVEV